MINKESGDRYPFALRRGTFLNERYLIEGVLGVGGFGITYKALDLHNNRICAIKELFIRDVVTRTSNGTNVIALAGYEPVFEHGITRFMDEAIILNQLNGMPNVVTITDYFQGNQTAYFVMEYIKGVSLYDMVAKSGGRLPFEEAKQIVGKVANTLERIYQEYSLFHRDISPDNIMIDENGEPQIIDFGTAKIYIRDVGQVHSIVLKPGFAPIEQYTGKDQGPWTDVYALAGVFYYIASGKRIPTSPDRLLGSEYTPLYELVSICPKEISDRLDECLKLNPKERVQSMKDFVTVMCISEKIEGAKARISVKYNEGDGEIWYIPEETDVMVGRMGDMSNIGVSDSAQISSQHCIVRYLPRCQQFQITDISTNGTYYNGTRMQKNKVYHLNPGSLVVLGDRVCAIELGVKP